MLNSSVNVRPWWPRGQISNNCCNLAKIVLRPYPTEPAYHLVIMTQPSPHAFPAWSNPTVRGRLLENSVRMYWYFFFTLQVVMKTCPYCLFCKQLYLTFDWANCENVASWKATNNWPGGNRIVFFFFFLVSKPFTASALLTLSGNCRLSGSGALAEYLASTSSSSAFGRVNKSVFIVSTYPKKINVFYHCCTYTFLCNKWRLCTLRSSLLIVCC